MYVAGNEKSNANPGEVNEYTLATPFFITSGVTHINTEDLSSTIGYIDGIVFNYDGTKMYLSSGGESGGDNTIRQYKLTTAFDIATLSLEGTLDLSNYSG